VRARLRSGDAAAGELPGAVVSSPWELERSLFILFAFVLRKKKKISKNYQMECSIFL
jgi:hypothetical protein